MSTAPLLIDTGIRIDGVPVRLTVSDWGKTPIGFVYHFEYRSVSDPPRGIPISETGYRSEFLMVEQPLGPDEFLGCAVELAAGLLASAPAEEAGQPGLFD